jgi:hypothetical protein
MLRVTLLVSHPFDLVPGQRFRFEQWLRLLPEGSVRADVRPVFSAASYDTLHEHGRTVRKAGQTAAGLIRRLGDVVFTGRPDVVLLYREAFPLGPPVFEWFVERRLPVVFDFDDAIFLRNTSDANRIVSRLKTPTKTEQIVSHSTITTVGNSYLAEYARRFSTHVHVLPTTIDVDEFRPLRKRSTGNTIRIGWSGSPTTASHLGSIGGALLLGLHGSVAICPHIDLDLCATTQGRWAEVAFICPDREPLSHTNHEYTRQVRRLVDEAAIDGDLPRLFVQSCKDDAGVHDEQVVPLVTAWQAAGGVVDFDVRRFGGHTSDWATAPLLLDAIAKLADDEPIDVRCYAEDAVYAPIHPPKRTPPLGRLWRRVRPHIATAVRPARRVVSRTRR